MNKDLQHDMTCVTRKLKELETAHNSQLFINVAEWYLLNVFWRIKNESIACLWLCAKHLNGRRLTWL